MATALCALAVAAIPLTALLAQPASAPYTIVETGQGFANLQDAVNAVGDARGTIGLLGSWNKAARGGAIWETKPGTEGGKPEVVQVGFVEPDWRAAHKLLAVRDPKAYAEKRQIELAGPDGGDLSVGVRLTLPVLEGDDAPDDYEPPGD